MVLVSLTHEAALTSIWTLTASLRLPDGRRRILTMPFWYLTETATAQSIMVRGCLEIPLLNPHRPAKSVRMVFWPSPNTTNPLTAATVMASLIRETRSIHRFAFGRIATITEFPRPQNCPHYQRVE